MTKTLLLSAIIATFSVAALAAENRELHFKSPAPGMRFTAGLPIQVWADIIPRDDGHPGWPQAECYWNDKQVGERVYGNNKAYDYFPFTVPAKLVTPGVHSLKLKGFGREGATRPAEKSLPVHVDPWPADKMQIDLTEDGQYTDLDWTNCAVRGHGHTVTVTGLSSIKIVDPSHADPNSVVAVSGLTGNLNGDVNIEGSIFEATGSVHLAIHGDGNVAIKNNEFRASNFIKFVPSKPDASPVIQISGKNTGNKLFQGNRVAAGIVRFDGQTKWLVGGDTDAHSNILIGPRCVLALVNCREMHVIGNYIHHDYRGTWSQGFNFYCENSDTILAEHNVLRASSWPLQSFGGEFRYNLMIDSGHNWVRVLTSGTKFHHNLLVHTGDPYGTGIGAGVWLYSNCKNVAIYNNTFDGGAPVARDFDAPIISLSTGCTLSTLRNNVFTGVKAIRSLANNAIVARGGKEADNDRRIAYADYNCFFNPHAPAASTYDREINERKDAGTHDVHADPKFVKGGLIPYTVDQADVWNRKYSVSQVLSTYRERYAPAAESPLLNAGDPADGKNSYIGAIGPGGDASGDRFGRIAVADLRNDGGNQPVMKEIVSKSTGMKLRLIPAGKFLMGSSAADVRAALQADPTLRKEYYKNEQPQHQVRISLPYYIGVTEVTQAEYEKVMGTNPSWYAKIGGGSDKVTGQETNKFPVEQVSWYDAIEFCNKLSEQDDLLAYYTMTNMERAGGSIKSATVEANRSTSALGQLGYRLPTEAEWEYSCRGNTTTPFHFGSVLNGDKANVDGNSPFGTTRKGTYLERTTTVGSYSANVFGLSDMHGNVWEWCFDVDDSSAYKGRRGISVDPVTMAGSDDRVLRGGSWYSNAGSASSASRGGESPGDRNYFVGFRVVR